MARKVLLPGLYHSVCEACRNRLTTRLTIRHRSLARLHANFNTILHLGITQLTLYTAITLVIYISIPGPYCYFKALLDREQLDHILVTRLLFSRVHVRLNNPPCHRKRPPPVRRQSPTTTTRGCYATPDHGPWPVPRIIHNPQP